MTSEGTLQVEQMKWLRISILPSAQEPSACYDIRFRLVFSQVDCPRSMLFRESTRNEEWRHLSWRPQTWVITLVAIDDITAGTRTHVKRCVRAEFFALCTRFGFSGEQKKKVFKRVRLSVLLIAPLGRPILDEASSVCHVKADDNPVVLLHLCLGPFFVTQFWSDVLCGRRRCNKGENTYYQVAGVPVESIRKLSGQVPCMYRGSNMWLYE